MATKLLGASVWEHELCEHLTSHEQNERGLLEEYQTAAARSWSPAFRYLSALILEDEHRHHRVFQELASALESDVEMQLEEPAVPRRLHHWGPDAAQVVQLTEELLAREHADAKELHRLAGGLKSVKDETLWRLLIKLMEMDTTKHIKIPEFVKRHARKSLE